MTVEDLVNRFDDLVAAVERIADACEAALADDVAKHNAEDRQEDDDDRESAK